MATEFTGVTAKIAKEAKLEVDMMTFLVSRGYEDYEDIAMACSTVDGTSDKFVKPMVAAEAKTAKDDGIGVVRLRKFWLACTERHAKDREPKKELDADEEAPIPEAEQITIEEMWTKRHNYVLPDAHLLIDNQQGRMWRDFTAKAKAVDVWLINKLRPRSCRALPANTMMAVVPGKAVKGIEVIADEVARSFDLFVRARAFFMTAAFVSISDITWFPLQSAISACEVIMNLITNTWENRSPPVSFHVTAWGTTVHHFSEQVRITKRTLKEVVENTGGWEHYWKWSPPGPSPTSGGSGGAPDNQSLTNQLNSMKGQLQQYKQQAEEANQRAITASRDRRERQEEYEPSDNKRRKGGFGGGGNQGKGGKGRGGKGAKKQGGAGHGHRSVNNGRAPRNGW